MIINKRFLQIVIGLLALGGCTGADILNLTVPRTGYKLHRDVAYGSNPRQRMDIYVPDVPDPSHTVVMFFYGGSWQKGRKELYRFVGQAFASKGYIAVVTDYRLYPEVYFPAFVEDSANAVAWVHHHIKEYGGNPAHMFLTGHSAGAYIAAMLTLNDSYLHAVGGSRQWIRGTVGLAGPYDFLPFTDPKIKALFSTAEDSKTQPITFVTSGIPPMLLLMGDADDEVRAKNSLNLAAKLRKFHDPVQEHVYQGVGHIGLVLSLSELFRNKAPVLQDIDSFIRAVNAGRPHP